MANGEQASRRAVSGNGCEQERISTLECFFPFRGVIPPMPVTAMKRAVYRFLVFMPSSWMAFRPYIPQVFWMIRLFLVLRKKENREDGLPWAILASPK
jgi:hypothetical protein